MNAMVKTKKVPTPKAKTSNPSPTPVLPLPDEVIAIKDPETKNATTPAVNEIKNEIKKFFIMKLF